jgi:excisionase family DNA binding protein
MATHYRPSQTVPEPLLDINAVARTLSKSRGFVYQLIQTGELRPVRVGSHWRFAQSDVRGYLERLGLPDLKDTA